MAFDQDQESVAEFSARLNYGLRTAIAMEGGLPLIVAHRSVSAFVNPLRAQDNSWDPNDESLTLLEPGGILAMTDTGLVPLHRCVMANWPSAGGRRS